MPATRAATQRAEAQRVSLIAAASNADTQPLSPELVEIVIKHLPRSQLASARLVSKQFAAAVDPLISAVAISRKRWDRRLAPLVGLQHVTRLDVGSEVNVSAQWRQLQHITSQLPKLNTLRSLSALGSFPVAFASYLSSLSSLTRLDLENGAGNPFPKGVPLPGLKAASFGFKCDLAGIAALAPNLEQLYCDNLDIRDSPAAALPACTHFGSYGIRFYTQTGPAHAFAAAFPNLQMVTFMPNEPVILQLSAQQLLAQSPAVRAVRGWSTLVMPNAAAAWPQVLLQLQRLCLHGFEDLHIPSISSMSQLQHVRVTFMHKKLGGTKLQALLRALAALPQLQSLVLPTGLLCSQCCPGVQSSLQVLTAKSSLKQLVFLEWWSAYSGMFEAGVPCTHPETIQAGLQSIAAAAASTQEHQYQQQQQKQQQQQQLIILRQQQPRQAVPGPWDANPDSAAGVWGVYGPPGEW